MGEKASPVMDRMEVRYSGDTYMIQYIPCKKSINTYFLIHLNSIYSRNSFSSQGESKREPNRPLIPSIGSVYLNRRSEFRGRYLF